MGADDDLRGLRQRLLALVTAVVEQWTEEQLRPVLDLAAGFCSTGCSISSASKVASVSRAHE
ncbi:MAG: hypothetical protein V9G18_20255, partial [Albidovulum sp.]